MDCPKGSSTCTIKDARNAKEFDGMSAHKLNENHLKFENSSLDSLHPSFFTTFSDLVTLDASSLQLKTIGNEQFNAAYQLENLNLSNNSLTMFNTSLLSKSKNLKKLDVSNNQIEDLDIEALKENNNNLKELNVSHNKMTNIVISESIYTLVASNNLLEQFKVSMNSKLTYLDVSGNSLLTDVKENFKHLQLIEYLNVGDVLLEPLEIDLFVEMEDLHSLMLRNTGITKIEYGTFSNLQDLRFLDLSYNQITDLDVNMLLVLRNLNSLYISGNKIMTFNLFQNGKPMMLNLKEVSIEQNNWECSSLAKLYYLLKVKNIEIMKLEYPKKDSTNVMFIECYQESTMITSTVETTLIVEDFTTTEASKQESIQLKPEIKTSNDDSAFYKVLSGVAITLVVVGILLKMKKYIKFSYCQSYKMVDEKDLRESSTEMI